MGILLSKDARIPLDPTTGRPYDRAQDRVENLIDTFQETNARILIPTPALAEFLVLVHPRGGAYIQELRVSYRFEIADFDEMAAIELAEIAAATTKPSKLERGEQTWAKLKYDRQIVAIAVARGVDAIYSTDAEVRKLAKSWNVSAFDLCDIPPPPPKQMLLDQPPELKPSKKTPQKAAEKPASQPRRPKT